MVQLLFLPGGHRVARNAGGGLLGLGGQRRAFDTDHQLHGDDPHLQKDKEEDVKEVSGEMCFTMYILKTVVVA